MIEDLKPTRDALTQDEARERAALIDRPSYRISLTLSSTDETYTGRVVIRFRARERAGTFLDFLGGDIAEFSINGASVPPHRDGHRIYVRGDQLRETNELTIAYRNRYDHHGVGFHRFLDPQDGRVYLYTDFEPFNAHRLFPCFDQPDLKATYDLDVTAPTSWVVVSNGRETSSKAVDAERTRRRFATLEPFSTYLFAVVAGPYVAVHDRAGDIELGLYCRESLRRFLDPDEIFDVTRKGFEFYADYFGCSYPFGKYDQIFVPEFNTGAMENVGAVTFNEAQIFRDPPTENQRLTRAEVILHELAHMWFGNLVTMRWWDGLWLNESFATYISFLAMSQATRFESCWENFLGTIKAWAYREDQKPTTHPIAGRVADTDQTFLNFDGITYGKGAAVLKQLRAHVGPDGFREGLRTYFARHAWGNTEFGDFLAAIESGSARELETWARKWLETSGVNTLRPVRGPDGHVALHQEPGNGDGVLRPHLVHVAALKRQEEDLAISERRTVLIDGATSPLGALEGDIIWCNLDDHAYARVFLDSGSLEHVRSDLHRVEDPLVRLGLWNTLWEMTRDGDLSPRGWLGIVERNLPEEKGTELLETVLRHSDVALQRYLPPQATEELGEKLFSMAWERVEKTPAGSDTQLLWARALIGFTLGAGNAKKLMAWLDETPPGGLTVDQGMRWSILIRATAFGLPAGESRLADEAKRDASDRGIKSLFAADVARPDPESKARVFERFVHAEGESADLLKRGMRAFWWPHQASLLAPYGPRFFAELPKVLSTQNLDYVARGFARLMFPHLLASESIVSAAERMLREVAAKEPVLERILLEESDELARILRLRAL